MITKSDITLAESVHGMWWKPIEEYLNEQQAYVMQKLATCKPEDLGRLQGTLAFIQQMLMLPETQKRKGEE
jgi:hypothetical protein